MTVLPSPVPHPLDFSPWDLPGWIYEALDWVVGVEWPEGNERTVWDLADQWYAVAEALAGPRADALAAATEVTSGYGNVGAVRAAFDAAFRRLAEGDDAPLTVLIRVSRDLGGLVEDCGCDIEAAKLEVWIELGILVVELVSLTVATVLTAGAASPAAGAAIAATRAAVHRIFQRLIARLAQRSLRQGAREASKRAARQVTSAGGRQGLARRAGRAGAGEAAEEAGVNLAIQGYQNGTGRGDGLDAAAVGRATLGGFAGGAAMPLAGLGRHATGPGARTAELFGREMAGEVIADNAASLVTGGGFVSWEDAARAAASGATGSAIQQGDAALQARLDGRLAVLDSSLPLADPPGPATTTAPGGSVPDRPPAVGGAAAEADHGSVPVSRSPSDGRADGSEPVVDRATRSGGSTAAGTATEQESPAGQSQPVLASVAATNSGAGVATVPTESAPVRTAGYLASSLAPPGVPGLPVQPASALAGPADPVSGLPVGPAPTPGVASPGPTRPSPQSPPGPADPRFPRLQALEPVPIPPRPEVLPSEASAATARFPEPRTPQWYEIRRVAGREGVDRRRYRGYLRFQRENYAEQQRIDEAAQLRAAAEQHEKRARRFQAQSVSQRRRGSADLARRCHRASERYLRECFRLLDRADAVLAGEVVRERVDVTDDGDFAQINDDVADLAEGAVRTSDRSALTGQGRPPPIDRSRRYGERGGLRRPLALHQTDLERHMPRHEDGWVLRTPDPRQGTWFRLANDGGPRADPARAINCLDCTLSLYETWVHGRPRVSAPRTFDGYAEGDVSRPVDGEAGGPRRVEEVTGGRFQEYCPVQEQEASAAAQAVERGFGDLHEQLLTAGHGSYAFVVTCWEQGGSHAWVALNQNGTVLYLDPQNRLVDTKPLFGHTGRPGAGNVVAIDALVLGADGRPLPVGQRRPGLFTSDLPWTYTGPVSEDQPGRTGLVRSRR